MKIIFAALFVSFAAGDPCTKVCESYTANRLGRGANLCDGPISTCNSENFCTHLYWSTTENGSRGLIYSDDVSDLFPEELANPVTCDQAFELEDITAINTGLNLFAHLPDVIGLLNNQELVAAAAISGSVGAQIFNLLRQTTLGHLTPELIHAYRRSIGGRYIKHSFWDHR